MIEYMHYSSQESLAALSLPPAMQSEFNDYVLFPSHMDSALQSVLALVRGTRSDKIYVPFTLGEVELLAPLTETGYVYVRMANRGDSEAFDIDITDKWGKPLIKMKDFTIGGMQHDLTETKRSNILFWHQEWRESGKNAESYQSSFGDIVVFSNEGALEGKLKERMTGHGRRVIRVQQGKTCRQITDHIYEVLPGSE
jgi:polyketide synthase PksN